MIKYDEIKLKITNYLASKRKMDLFSKAKKHIKITHNEILIESIDMNIFNISNQLNQYIKLIAQKYPTHNLTFLDCNLDGINLNVSNTRVININNCNIKGLTVNDSIKCYIYFNNTNFLSENENDILVKAYRINLDNCNLYVNGESEIVFGKNNTSTINIKSLNVINDGEFNFKININANNIFTSNYKTTSNTELSINKNVTCIHLVNSDINFKNDMVIDSQLVTLENSNISNITANIKSLEILGNCNFNSVKLLECDDMIINENASLNTNDFDLNLKFLECRENSEINDINNKLTWIKNINKIICYKNFRIKYNNKILFTQSKQNVSTDTEEEIIKATENVLKLRR